MSDLRSSRGTARHQSLTSRQPDKTKIRASINKQDKQKDDERLMPTGQQADNQTRTKRRAYINKKIQRASIDKQTEQKDR